MQLESSHVVNSSAIAKSHSLQLKLLSVDNSTKSKSQVTHCTVSVKSTYIQLS